MSSSFSNKSQMNKCHQDWKSKIYDQDPKSEHPRTHLCGEVNFAR